MYSFIHLYSYRITIAATLTNAIDISTLIPWFLKYHHRQVFSVVETIMVILCFSIYILELLLGINRLEIKGLQRNKLPETVYYPIYPFRFESVWMLFNWMVLYFFTSCPVTIRLSWYFKIAEEKLYNVCSCW